MKDIEPLLMRSVAPKVIFISNTSIANGYPYHHAYSVAKAGLEAMVQLYNIEKEKFKIKVKLVKLESLKVGLLKKFYAQENKNNIENFQKEVEKIIKIIVND